MFPPLLEPTVRPSRRRPGVTALLLLGGSLSSAFADHGPKSVRDSSVPVAGHVLVDQRGPRAAVPHPRHQLPRTGPGRRGQRVARVPEIVEVQLGRDARSLPGLDPVVAEVAAPQLPALRPDEDVPVTAGSGEVLQVVRDRVEQFGGKETERTPAADFGALSKSRPSCNSA